MSFFVDSMRVCCGMRYTQAFKFGTLFMNPCRTNSGSIKTPGFIDFLHSNNPQYSSFQHYNKKTNNMQFKVISALVFATLAAASAIPDNNPANASPATTPSNPTTGNTKPGNTNPSNTNSGAKVAPPFPATNGGTPPTIDASKCSSGHLLCCKFHFSKIVIVLR